ncbi:MAG TPA: hypothetical protein VFY75_01985 [Solirubrobacterales bacterium]|nr:hypothetical protein [Solirubrobacterales bacterium]
MAKPRHSLDKRPELDPVVIAEINKAYYSRLVEAPERERVRALNGFTIASAIVAAIVAAGLAKGLGDASAALRSIGYATLVLWLLAGGGYLAAVAGWSFRQERRRSADNANDAAWNRIEETEAEMRSIRLPMSAAQALSLIALAATLLLVGIALFQESPGERQRVVLTAAGTREVAAFCERIDDDRPATHLRAEVDRGSLEGNFAELGFSAGGCMADAADVLIRSDAIRAILTE